MTDTYFYLPADKAGRLVELYAKGSMDKPHPRHDNEAYRNYAVSGARTYFSGGARLVSTVEESEDPEITGVWHRKGHLDFLRFAAGDDC